MAVGEAPRGAAYVRDTMTGGPALVGPGDVRVYLCGVTAYDESHIGHARTAVVFDVLRRHLEEGGSRVRLVQNVTDVDDKIIARAEAEGTSAAAVAARYAAAHEEACDALGVLRPSASPRATDHVPHMVRLIEGLVRAGRAYEAGGGVYFDVSSFPGYGRLSGKSAGGLRAGARVEPDPAKRSPLDFALWKPSSGEPSWESPWGRGRPGWHVECSAMCREHMGGPCDLHGGGRDLIFPHHENEIAQSESLWGGPLARAWMHVGMVTSGGEKMSKSLGNAAPVLALIREHGPGAVRAFCLGAHYAKPVDYTPAALGACARSWGRARLAYFALRQAPEGPAGGRLGGRAAEAAAAFDRALGGGMDTRAALGSLYGLASDCLSADPPPASGDAEAALPAMERMMRVLGLDPCAPPGPEWAGIASAVAARAAARAAGRYGEADAARAALAARGVSLVDAGGRTVWVPAERRPGYDETAGSVK